MVNGTPWSCHTYGPYGYGLKSQIWDESTDDPDELCDTSYVIVFVGFTVFTTLGDTRLGHQEWQHGTVFFFPQSLCWMVLQWFYIHNTLQYSNMAIKHPLSMAAFSWKSTKSVADVVAGILPWIWMKTAKSSHGYWLIGWVFPVWCRSLQGWTLCRTLMPETPRVSREHSLVIWVILNETCVPHVRGETPVKPVGKLNSSVD